MDLYTKLAFQNIIRHPLRSLITIVGIALGVAVILAVSMLNDTTRDVMEKTTEELGSGNTDIWVEEFGENASSIGSRLEGFSEEIIADISAHSAVLSVHPSLKLYVMGVSDRQQDPLEFYLCGIRFFDDSAVREHILSAGSYPDDPQHILIGQELARMFEVSIGSPLTIQTPTGPLVLTVSGLLRPDKGSGLWCNNQVMFADLAVVQEFFHYDNIVTSLNIVLKPNTSALNVASEIKGFFPEQVKVMTDPLMVATKGDNSGQLRIMLLLYSFVSIVIAMFIIYNTLSSPIEESRKEIGMLRLVGMTSQQMIRFFLRQALMYAMIGSCMGIAFGIVLGWVMITLLRRIFTYQAFSLILPSPASLLTAIGIGIVVTMIVALLPAIKTATIPPLVVFREREAEQETTHRLTGQTLTGFVLIIVTLLLGMIPNSGMLAGIIHLTIPIILFIGLILTLGYMLPFILRTIAWCFTKIFGVPGMLAAKSLQLRLKRTVVTISAIVVTATISIGMLGSVVDMKRTTSEWLDTTRWADVLVFSASGAAMDESIVKKVGDLPFIQSINPIRYFFVSYEHPKLSDKGFLFQAVYPTRFHRFTGVQVVEGNTLDAIQQIEEQSAILVNAGLARMLGLKHGDTLRINTQNGVVDFPVAGSVVDYTDFIHRMGKIVYGSYKTLAEYWEATGYTVLQIRLANGYTEDEAKSLLSRELSGTYDVKIMTHSEEKKEVGAFIDKIFASNYTMTTVMFLIVFMGIFNAVFINVLFQIREFAILRTLGLLVRQIRLMIFCEALAIGIIGSLFAGVVGIWFGWQMTLGTQEMMGIVFQYHIPWMIIGLTIIITVPIAIGAALYPQKVATNRSIANIFRHAE